MQSYFHAAFSEDLPGARIPGTALVSGEDDYLG